MSLPLLGNLPLNKPVPGISNPFWALPNGDGLADFSTASAVLVDVTGMLSHQNASTGDLVLVFFSCNCFCSSGAQTWTLQAVTVTGGNIIQRTTMGNNAGLATASALVAPYVVAAGDIAAGVAQIKIQASVTGGATFTIKNGGKRIPCLTTINLSQ